MLLQMQMKSIVIRNFCVIRENKSYSIIIKTEQNSNFLGLYKKFRFGLSIITIVTLLIYSEISGLHDLICT